MSVDKHVSAERDNYRWKEQGRSEYDWPASRMVWENIRKLTRIGNFLKRPINQVLVDATESYAAAILPMLEGKAFPLEKQELESIANGFLVWQDASIAKTEHPIVASEQSDLVETINELRQEVLVLRQAIDELREAYEHAIRNQEPVIQESMPSPSDVVAVVSFPTKKEESQTSKPALRGAEETKGKQLDLF